MRRTSESSLSVHSTPDNVARAVHSIGSSVSHSDTDNDEGFLQVPTRKRHKDKPHSDKHALDINTQHVVNLLTQNSTDPPIIDLLTPRNPDVAPRLLDLSTPPKSRRSAEAKIATFSELLNDRIQEAMLDVDRRALDMETRYNKYAANLRSTERKQQALREKMSNKWPFANPSPISGKRSKRSVPVIWRKANVRQSPPLPNGKRI